MTFPCPINIYDSSMADEVSKTPAFKGFWFHTTMVKMEICSNGWNPQRNKNSIYGAAIYLSRKKWELNDLCPNNLGHTSPIDLDTIKSGLRGPNMFVCVLVLQDSEVQSCFPSEKAPKAYTGDHLIDYLNLNVPEDKSGPRGYGAPTIKTLHRRVCDSVEILVRGTTDKIRRLLTTSSTRG